MSTFCDREIASRAGRTKISRMSASELTAFTTSGGNALLRMYGAPYYSALGQKSAAKRAEISRLGWQPRENGRRGA
jgi:hypothetical protein